MRPALAYDELRPEKRRGTTRRHNTHVDRQPAPDHQPRHDPGGSASWRTAVERSCRFRPGKGSARLFLIQRRGTPKKGEPLATIHSAEIADLEKQRKEAEQQLAVATRNLEAIESMTQAGLNSERDLLQARQQAADAQAEMERLRKLAVLYTTNNETHYLLKAPISGFITKREINPNMMVRPDQEEALFTITGLDQVWIMADVYESDISKVHEGMPVRVTTLAYADREFQGFIDKIYQVLDEESKTMRVRVRLNNPDYLLKPGMFASVYAQDKNRQQMMPRINNHAIIFENG